MLVLEQFLGSYEELAGFAAHVLRYASNKFISISSNQRHSDPELLTPMKCHERPPSVTEAPPSGPTKSSRGGGCR